MAAVMAVVMEFVKLDQLSVPEAYTPKPLVNIQHFTSAPPKIDN